MFKLTILVILTVFIIDLTLSVLNYKHRNAPIPSNVADVYDKEEYSKWLRYTMEITRMSIISKVLGRAVMLALLFFGIFPFFASLVAGVTENVILQSLLFLALYSTVNYVLSIGFQVYRTFNIEERYGFNTSTPRVFITDQIKSIIMATILGGLVLYIILYLYDLMGVNSLFYSWLIIIAISLVFNLLYSKVFVRMFNKLTPLTEGELYDMTKALAEKTGYEVTKISIMDASKRSTKLNAYFSGFGKFKQIILYDTLIEKCTNDEIISILAHEIGHAKHKDVFKNFIIMTVQSGVFLYVLSFFLSSDTFAAAFGFKQAHYGFAFILFNILMEPIGMILGIPMSAYSRKAEFKADAYAGKSADRQAMISALKVLARENYSNLTPHPMVVKMTYSHPPMSERIKALDK